jgi:hypothetical protein
VSVRLIVVCDTPRCLAAHAPAPGTGRAGLVTTAVQAGWRSDGAEHETCPACAAGRGPVLERGECPVCMGRQVDRAAGATCLYCGHVVPHGPDDLDA